MANDCVKRCKAKFFCAGKRKFSLNKAKKKTFFGGKFGSLPTFRSLVREKARNVFVMSLRLSDHKVLHNIASSSGFLDFAWNLSLFSLVIRTSKFWEFKEFNKTIISFALVGYETGYYLLILVGPMRTLKAGQKIAPSIPVCRRCDRSPPRMPSQLVSFFLHSSSPRFSRQASPPFTFRCPR